MHVGVPRIALAPPAHRSLETGEMQPPSRVARAEFDFGSVVYRTAA